LLKSIGLFFLLLVSCFNSLAAQPPVILLSIDGFSNEYLTKYKPQNILALAQDGVQAKALLPVFPSKTFPNHLSIVTGMYPSHHGIVHNRFYHKKLKKNYKLGAGKNNSDWLTALPIWTVAEQQGVKTAVYFWPESEAKIAGRLPHYNFPYKHNTPNIQRMSQIIEWLKYPLAEQPRLIVSYFSTVDTAGHKYGPNSIEVERAIDDIDKLIGKFVHRLRTEIKQPVNIILVSDHGMVLSGINNVIDTNKVVTLPNDVIMVNGQTQLYFYSDNSQALNDVRSQILAKSKKTKQYQIFDKTNYPEHWHLTKQGVLTPDLIINALPPYTFVTGNKHISFATHGFDSKNNHQLEAIFIANGPSFKRELQIDAFENIHIFPLLIKLLSLNNTENIDGDSNVLLPILN
jgi:predicted AlkP superfamily pyrophosphatase or phosphodiesterase